MDFSKINIEGVMIGSLIGLFSKTIFDRVTTSLKLNRQRKIILAYSKQIGLDKCSQYIKDSNFVEEYILADTEEEIKEIKDRNYTIDAMPMFTSAIFKSFSQDELRRTAFSTNNYIDVCTFSRTV